MAKTKILFVSPLGFDYMTSQCIEGFHLLAKQNIIDFKCNLASTHHGAQVEDLELTTDPDELIRLSKEWADFVFLSSAGNMVNLSDIEKAIYDDDSIIGKKAFIDGHDGNGYLIQPDKFRRYFKREYRLPENTIHSFWNTRPLNFGIYNYHTSDWQLLDNNTAEDDWKFRDIDISFVCFTGSNPMRGECIEVLKKIKESGKVNVYIAGSDKEQPISKEEYDNVLTRSKVSISVVGAGIDCLRYWEIPAKGAVLCSFDLTNKLHIRNNFEHWRSALFFNTWKSMVDYSCFVVYNKDVWKSIRLQADLVRRQHTTMMRAKEILLMIYGV